MNARIILDSLAQSGNMRTLPHDRTAERILDFSTNDYLGLAGRNDLRLRFMDSEAAREALFTSSASRLLAATQSHYEGLENTLASLYDREVLMFNSGYHANSGLIPALTDRDTVIIADRLVHASIIDGIMLSKCEWTRFRHNDMEHLEKILETRCPGGKNALVIVESIYSMDGDSAPVEELISIKKRHPALMLYIDEAHALGVAGNRGLGLAASSSCPEAFDVIIGTLGKAAASMGAYAALSDELRRLAVNRCRSLIFSTALPPVNALWSTLMINTITTMDAERAHLTSLSRQLADGLSCITGRAYAPSHIQPLIVGDAKLAVELSQRLALEGLKVLPIRTPTVPPGTERLRMSLSAAMSHDDVDLLLAAISKHLPPHEYHLHKTR